VGLRWATTRITNTTRTQATDEVDAEAHDRPEQEA
jgi:hypothetical protein